MGDVEMFAEISIRVTSMSESLTRPILTLGFKDGDRIQMTYEEWTDLVEEVEEASDRFNSKVAVKLG